MRHRFKSWRGSAFAGTRSTTDRAGVQARADELSEMHGWAQVGRHRLVSARSRLSRVVARLSVIGLVVSGVAVPFTGSSTATDALTCASHDGAQREACESYSRVVTAIIEAVVPGATTALASALATGYRTGEDSTITCALGVSCDAWPIAVSVSASLIAEDATQCTFGSESVCRAARAAVSGAASGTVAATITELLPRVAAVPIRDRTSRLSDEVSEALKRIDPVGQELSDALIGVVTLALFVIPSTSPGALVPVETNTQATDPADDGSEEVRIAAPCGPVVAGSSHDVSAGVNGSQPLGSAEDTAEAGGDLLLADLEAVCAAEGKKVLKSCAIVIDLFAKLEPHGDDWSNEFELEGWAGVTNLRWRYPTAKHSHCNVPRVRFHGTIFVSASSNGTGPVSRTNQSTLAAATRYADLRGYSAAVWQFWRTKKVEVERGDFPEVWEVKFHVFRPPMGFYTGFGVGDIMTMNGYRWSDGDTDRIYVFHCTKNGYDPTACNIYERDNNS